MKHTNYFLWCWLNEVNWVFRKSQLQNTSYKTMFFHGISMNRPILTSFFRRRMWRSWPTMERRRFRRSLAPWRRVPCWETSLGGDGRWGRLGWDLMVTSWFGWRIMRGSKWVTTCNSSLDLDLLVLDWLGALLMDCVFTFVDHSVVLASASESPGFQLSSSTCVLVYFAIFSWILQGRAPTGWVQWFCDNERV